MDSALHGQIHAVFKPFDNLIKPLLELIDSGFKPRDHLVKIVLGCEIGQDVLDECLGLRFGRLPVETGGFERLNVGQSVDRHCLCVSPQRLPARYIPNYAGRGRETMDGVMRRWAGRSA